MKLKVVYWIACAKDRVFVETKLFSACRSMQNIQSLHCTNGVNKYVCKYCAKLDQQNYIITKSHPYDSGTLITKSHFLHNTKITTSAINEKNDGKNREKNLPMGRAIPFLQMIQQLLGYPEVFICADSYYSFGRAHWY